jgi:hypothetical protein
MMNDKEQKEQNSSIREAPEEISPQKAQSKKTLLKKIISELSASPEKVRFPAGNAR